MKKYKTYWDNNGKYNDLVKEIDKKVPDEGASNDNVVEIFRLLQNAYYDLYNNGGGNEHKWNFVEPIKNLLNNVSYDKKEKFLGKVVKFRASMTKYDAFPINEKKAYKKAEKAINSFCKMYLHLNKQ